MLRAPHSLFWSLTASIVGVLILTAVLQMVIAFAVVEPIVRARQTSQAGELVESVAPELEAAIEGGREGAVQGVLMRYQRLAEGILLAYEPVDGSMIFPGPPGRRPRGQEGPRGGRRGLLEGGPPGRADLPVILRHDIQLNGEKVGALVILRARPGFVFTQWLPLRWVFLFPVSLLAAALGGMWIFRRLQRRLRVLEDQARAVGEGDLDVRIDAPGNDEIGRLGQQLNSMTGSLAVARDRVDSMESERRRMLADITHELTTPLTSVRGFAETLLDGRVSLDADQRSRYLRDIVHASERMGLLIDDLLDLARLEGGGDELERESLDFAALVRNSVERQRPRFDAANLSIDFSGIGDGLLVEADGRRLEQVVDNLLANALRHVPAGGTVRADVQVADQGAVLEVRDDGPGFSNEAIPHVFERFYRGEASRTIPGSGLGLAIVREIVLRHGGTIEAANQASGGAKLTVRLPLGNPAAI